MSIVSERAAQISAHRVCTAGEHDPSAGKVHGTCVVCGEDWPCDYSGPGPALQRALSGLRLLFDGPPSPEGPRFVEAEIDGRSVRIGKWTERLDDGLWELDLGALLAREAEHE